MLFAALKAQVKANKQINVAMPYTEGNRWYLNMYYGTE